MSAIGAWCWRMVERADRLHDAVILLSGLGRRGVPFVLRLRQLRHQDGVFTFSRGVFGKPIYLRGGTTDFSVFKDIFLLNSYAAPRVPLWDHFIAETRGTRAIVIDCGANIGLSAVFFAETFPGAHILAVEPDANNFHILRKNVAAYPNIVPIHAGVWDRAGSLSVVDPKLGAHGIRTEESDRGSHIPALTMPDLLVQAGEGRPVIVKIDIEGAEAELFRSNTAWLDEVDVIMIELHDYMLPGRRLSSNFFNAMAGRRFEVLQKDLNMLFFLEHRLAKQKRQHGFDASLADVLITR